MKISIYKPYKEILFNDEFDTNSWSREIVNLAKIFAKNNHQIHILSKTDYDSSITNITTDFTTETDVLMISNGVFDKDINSEIDVLSMFPSTKKILLETDVNLSSRYHDESLYDLILTQQPTLGKRQYAQLEKLVLVGHPLYDDSFESRDKKGIFVGYERDRLQKVTEFVYRPNINWYGKSETFNFKNQSTKSMLTELLRKHLFSVVISGDEQNSRGFVSQRYFENCVHGCVNFVDSEYDKDELVISKNDFRRVTNFLDLQTKLNSMNQTVFSTLQQQQFSEITPYLDGQLLYEHIYKLIK